MALELGSSESWLLPRFSKTQNLPLIFTLHPYPFPFTLKPFTGNGLPFEEGERIRGNHV